MIFTTDLRRHFSQASQILIHLIMCGLIPYLGEYKYGKEGFEFGLKLSALYFLTIFSIHIVVHYRYHAVEKGRKLYFNEKTGIYTLNDKSCEIRFSNQDIDKVDYIVSRAFLGKGLHYFPWDSYCYAQLHFKNGDKLIITSLLLPDLVWPSKFQNPVRIERFFCWPPLRL